MRCEGEMGGGEGVKGVKRSREFRGVMVWGGSVGRGWCGV